MLLLLGTGCAPDPPSQPSFILVSLDTMRADHVSSYDYARNTTPFFDALASEGVLFDSAVTVAGNTLVAHASMLTGLQPLAHGARHEPEGRALPETCQTLAEDFSDAGYATAGFTAHATWLTESFGFAQGFDHFESSWDDADAILPRAAAWIDDQEGQPFFLFVHLYDIHSEFKGRPYGAPAPFAGRWTSDYDGPFAGDWSERDLHGSKLLLAIDDGSVASSPADIAHFADQYDEGLAFTDDRLGRFVAGLSDFVRDNSYLVVTSDHGESFMDHGTMLHRFVFDEVMRVPLLIVPPRVFPSRLGKPRRVSEQISLVDLRPTLLGLAELPAGEWVQGASYLPFLAGEVDRCPALPASLHSRGLRFEGFKLIHSGPQEALQLYDLSTDPGEQHNLAENPEHGRRVVEMARWIKTSLLEHHEVNDRLMELETGALTVEMDDESLQSLRALGYLGDDGEH
jgi:arylsulfatase A-like enzyme